MYIIDKRKMRGVEEIARERGGEMVVPLLCACVSIGDKKTTPKVGFRKKGSVGSGNN